METNPALLVAADQIQTACEALDRGNPRLAKRALACAAQWLIMASMVIDAAPAPHHYPPYSPNHN